MHWFRRNIVLDFLHGINLTPVQRDKLLRSVNITKRFYKRAPIVSIEMVRGEALGQLDLVRCLILFYNIRTYEATRKNRAFVIDYLNGLPEVVPPHGQ